ncbi:hypothetical protein Ae505Ps2_6248 [Pseudonocardia sp. Ae505_Ps2]|nr:hypothetical protein Ae505Ps2_6248 [Pseudonocardia sp. Ae505_Ps2]
MIDIDTDQTPHLAGVQLDVLTGHRHLAGLPPHAVVEGVRGEWVPRRPQTLPDRRSRLERHTPD